MKKKVKTVCQIIRFRGKIEAFLVSIDLFDIPIKHPLYPISWHVLFVLSMLSMFSMLSILYPDTTWHISEKIFKLS